MNEHVSMHLGSSEDLKTVTDTTKYQSEKFTMKNVHNEECPHNDRSLPETVKGKCSAKVGAMLRDKNRSGSRAK
jgi:hypothetical protein